VQKRELKPEQISEWAESQVTLELKKLVEGEIAKVRSARADAYHPYQPERTQEILAALHGADDTWDIVAAALEGDWTFFEVDDGEQVRDHAEG
jgi:hypothetical protein